MQENERSTKIPQTPKKSSRLSKTAPVMTPKEDPVKKSSRRTARIPYSSRRRTSPKKADQNDMSREPSPTISESALAEEAIAEGSMQEETVTQEEPIVQEVTPVQEEKPLSPKKDEQEETKDLLLSIENKDINSMSVIKDEVKNANVDENEKNTNISQVCPVKSPVDYSDTDVSVSKESLDDKDETDQKQESTVIKLTQETVENIHIKESQNTVTEAQENEKSIIINDARDKIDTNTKKDTDIEHEEENIESIDNDHIVESINDTKTTDIPDPEQQINELLEEDQYIDISENDELKEEELLEDKTILSTSEKEIDSSIEKKQDEEVYFIN